jgi:hypothetical protein
VRSDGTAVGDVPGLRQVRGGLIRHVYSLGFQRTELYNVLVENTRIRYVLLFILITGFWEECHWGRAYDVTTFYMLIITLCSYLLFLYVY